MNLAKSASYKDLIAALETLCGEEDLHTVLTLVHVQIERTRTEFTGLDEARNLFLQAVAIVELTVDVNGQQR